MDKGQNTVPVLVWRGSRLIKSFESDPSVVLLEALRKAGLEVPSNCQSGTCGTCMMTLKNGAVTHPDPLPAGIDENWIEEGAFLACVAKPESPIEIDLRPPI